MGLELNRLKSKIAEANRYASKYSPAEMAKARDDIQAIREGFHKTISGEAIRDLDRSAYHLQSVNNSIREKKRKALNSYDSQRLSVELSIASALLQVANKSADKLLALERLVDDVKASGDKYKAKALYELLPGAYSPGNGIDEGLKINSLRSRLEKDVAEVIPSDEDKQKVYEAHNEYKKQAIEFRQIASLLGVTDVDHPMAGSEMAKAFQRYDVRANEFGLPDIVEKK